TPTWKRNSASNGSVTRDRTAERGSSKPTRPLPAPLAQPVAHAHWLADGLCRRSRRSTIQCVGLRPGCGTARPRRNAHHVGRRCEAHVGRVILSLGPEDSDGQRREDYLDRPGSAVPFNRLGADAREVADVAPAVVFRVAVEDLAKPHL